MRKRVDNILCLLTASRNIVLGEGQYFCRVNAFWEIWGPKETNGLIYCLTRIPDKQVLRAIEKAESARELARCSV